MNTNHFRPFFHVVEGHVVLERVVIALEIWGLILKTFKQRQHYMSLLMFSMRQKPCDFRNQLIIQQ